MGRYLLIGAGFTRNWGGPLSEEVTGSLLGDLHDDSQIAAALRNGPFEEAFQGFVTGPTNEAEKARLVRFQNAITGLFSRLNKSLLEKEFEFDNDIANSVLSFLARFDAIFSLNQDLLLEIHYIPRFIAQRQWSGAVLAGMTASPPPNHTGPINVTMNTWRPSGNIFVGTGFQPIYKLHGSSNWQSDSGEPVLIMGNAKARDIPRFSILQNYHEEFSRRLCEGNAKLMVIGYSFQDEHINAVITRASRDHGLGTYLFDLRGRGVLPDPAMERAPIRVKRDVEDIKLIGELRRPLSSVFKDDKFAHGEMMRFFL